MVALRIHKNIIALFNKATPKNRVTTTQYRRQDTMLSLGLGGERCSDDISSADSNFNDEMRREQMNLLPQHRAKDNLMEINAAPLFTWPVLQHAQQLAADTTSVPVTQYGFLAGVGDDSQKRTLQDSRIFYNVSAPASTFICGSQGSGKSHTLSCILENCLMQSKKLGSLPHPLTGIVFHYDDHMSDSHVSPCEAAYLGSGAGIAVRVLCSPTNIRAVENSYAGLANVTVETLCIDQEDLNTQRMLELMAFDIGAQPLYAQVIQRILRDMRRKQQNEPGQFSYAEFRSMLDSERLSPDQLRGLRQRLDTLESFMVPEQVESRARERKLKVRKGTNWEPKAGGLIIVDLSCPCVTATMACALFNICLSIFKSQKSSIGRIVALDEAHKYMGESSDSAVFTDSLLRVIRQQRHMGIRIIISTQEPTISPKLLDLCNITIVHRFSSPDWLAVLTKHLAGLSSISRILHRDGNADTDDEEDGLSGIRGLNVSPQGPIQDLFSQIVELRTGEALAFAPSGIMSVQRQKDSQGCEKMMPRKLGHQVLRVIIRGRITEDGGKSIMAS